MSDVFFPAWKDAPFLRLVPPLMLGIFIQWTLQLWIWIGWIVLIIVLLLFLRFSINDPYVQFRYNWIYGVFVNLLVVCLGILLCSLKDLGHSSSCILNAYSPGDWIIATLDDEPVERSHSFRLQATVKYIRKKDKWLRTQGSIFIYMDKKQDPTSTWNVGSILVFRKRMERIHPSGNPGTLDYQRFCAFRQIYLQVFLKKGESFQLAELYEKDISYLVHQLRMKMVNILRRWLSGKKETGLAEALLIGYRNDLDPELLQSYSHTGTVHIIAISGLHLALIYGLLRLLLKPIYRKKSIISAGPLISILALWLFALLTGASPSVLRSALMFTLIIVGECLAKKNSTLNGLFASAFFLLCYNPFWLWDPGFQLSHSAVLGILLFMKPIYDRYQIRSKIGVAIWKSMSLCLSAQLLTTPISIYHFHQFPNYFLISNLVAIPLSSVLLIGEILLCGTVFLPLLASILGKIISFLCWLMNSWVELVERIPYSTWTDLQISFLQLVLLFLAIACSYYGYNNKSKLMSGAAIVIILWFFILRVASFLSASHQQLLIVYNIPRAIALDCLSGRSCTFFGDSVLDKENPMSHFYVRPSRMKYRSIPSSFADTIKNLGLIYEWGSKRMIFLEHWNRTRDSGERIPVDLIVISRNPDLQIIRLNKIFDCSLWVFDQSNDIRKIRKWQMECLALGLSSYSVPDQGALVCNMKDGP